MRKRDAVGCQTRGKRDGRFVRVDVEGALRERSDDGNRPGRERVEHRGGPGRQRVAHQAQLGQPPSLEADRVAHQPDGAIPQRGAERLVHGHQGFPDDVERRVGGDPSSFDELDLESPPAHPLGDLRARSVHDADLVASGGQPARELLHSERRRGATALDEHAAHVVYSALMRT